MYALWLLQPYSLALLEERLRGMYKSVTEGKFGEALRQVQLGVFWLLWAPFFPPALLLESHSP